MEEAVLKTFPSHLTAGSRGFFSFLSIQDPVISNMFILLQNKVSSCMMVL